MKNRPFRERIGFALTGWRTGWARENSFRTQASLAGLAALVLALELLNSAMEAVIDLLHPGIHPSIKVAKDLLAGAVLLTGVAALAVAVAMVVDAGPRFLAEIGLWESKPG